MLGYLILLFTLIPAIELTLLLKIGAHIGAGNTFLLIILTGIIGAYLARYQGFLILKKIQSNLNQGIMPTAQMLDGLMILIGGIVLLTPGFITDIFGLLLLIPWTRSLIQFWFKNKLENMIKRGQVISFTSFGPGPNKKQYDDIDL